MDGISVTRRASTGFDMHDADADVNLLASGKNEHFTLHFSIKVAGQNHRTDLSVHIDPVVWADIISAMVVCKRSVALRVMSRAIADALSRKRRKSI